MPSYWFGPCIVKLLLLKLLLMRIDCLPNAWWLSSAKFMLLFRFMLLLRSWSYCCFVMFLCLVIIRGLMGSLFLLFCLCMKSSSEVRNMLDLSCIIWWFRPYGKSVVRAECLLSWDSPSSLLLSLILLSLWTLSVLSSFNSFKFTYFTTFYEFILAISSMMNCSNLVMLFDGPLESARSSLICDGLDFL